ncbi:MAG: molecular chaperone TorD family protein [Euryarchaeota archaeon]|nr:molecular chaperone TorD family protein [Euryarchaeota archaeon]
MSEKNFKDFEELAEARSNIYNFFSLIYSFKPSKEFVEKIKDKNFLLALRSFSGSIFASLSKFIENSELNTLLNELEIEYTRLFTAPGLDYVPPYESVYKDKWTIEYSGVPEAGLSPKTEVVEGLLYGKSTVAVKEKYRKAGVKISENCKDLPDHIGLELEFMHYLTNKEFEAWKSRDKDSAIKFLEMQKEFLTEHLITWAPKFCSKVKESSKHIFYKTIAKLTKEYIELEHKEMDLLIEEAKKSLKIKLIL